MFESEHILKVFYTENGSTADLLATLQQRRGWAHQLTLGHIEVGASYLDGSGPYPERLAHLVLTGRFLEVIDRWSAWAAAVIDDWAATPRDAAPT